MEALGVISTCISFPSSSLRGFTIAVVCCRLAEDVNARFVCTWGFLLVQTWRSAETGTLGSRKSRIGSGVLERYLRGVSWRNARAADDEVEDVS